MLEMDIHMSDVSQKKFRATQLAIVLGYVIATRVCSGQVSVNVGDVQGKKDIEAREGEETMLVCQYEPDPSHVINSVVQLQWRKDDIIGSISGAGDVSYNAPYSAPAYVISSTDVNKGLNLTIQNVSVTDNGTYTCQVTVRDPTLNTYVGTAVLSVGPPDPCKINPCQNGGTCRDVNGEPECTCPDGYTGVTCGGLDPCKINPCQNGGTCRDVNGEPECTCPDGYTGVTCGGLASDGLTTGQIVGICVGAGAFVAVLLVFTLCIFCRESLSQQCSCLQCKSSVNPEKEGGTTDKEALELNGGSTSNKEKEEG